MIEFCQLPRRSYRGKKSLSDKWYWKDQISTCKGRNQGHYLTHTQKKLKMDQKLNIRAKTLKLFEENIGVNFHDLRLGSGFLDITSKMETTKGKNIKLYFTKIKNLCCKRHHQEN